MTDIIYRDATDSGNRDKDIVSGPSREQYELKEQDRYYRAYLDETNQLVAEFAKDPERPELHPAGNFRFELTLLSATETSPQQQVMQMTAPQGLTLEQLSGGSQEWLDALMQANPGYMASEDLSGKQVKIPYGETRTTLTAHDKGMPPNWGRMMGSTVPTAPQPYLPYPKTVGGFKQYLPVIVGVVVTIAVMVTLKGAGKKLTQQICTRLMQSTAMKMMQMTAISAVSASAGSAAAQLTAMELYPELLPDGFSWDIVGDSALLGAMMGLTQSVGYLAFGLPLEGSQALQNHQTLMRSMQAMQRGATSYLTNYAYQKVTGNGQGTFDMRGLVGVMLSNGITETLLQQSGFINDANAPWTPETAINDVISVLGGGFADAAFEQAFSGTPMNPEKVFALSIGRLVGRQYAHGAKAIMADTGDSLNTQGQASHQKMIDALEESNTQEYWQHQVKAPNEIPQKTNALGHSYPRPPAVEEVIATPMTPRQKAKTTFLYDQQKMEQRVAEGSRYPSSKERKAALARNEDFLNEIDAYNTQARARQQEMPWATESFHAQKSKKGTRQMPEVWEEEEYTDAYVMSGKIVGYENEMPIIQVPPIRVTASQLPEEVGVFTGPFNSSNAEHPDFMGPRPQGSRYIRPGSIAAPQPDGFGTVSAVFDDGRAQLSRAADATAFSGRAEGQLLNYGSKVLKGAAKATGMGGNVYAYYQAQAEYAKGNIYAGDELMTRAVGGALGGSWAIGICTISGVGALPGGIMACGVAGSLAGDYIGAGTYKYIINPVITSGWYHETFRTTTSPDLAYLVNQRIIPAGMLGPHPPQFKPSPNWLNR